MAHRLQPAGRDRGRRPQTGGFTIVELLIGLMLTAMLMAGLALAVRAAGQSYQANDEKAQLTQTARCVLDRMGGEIRTAANVTTDGGTLITITPPPNNDNITLIEYELVTGTLYMRRTVGTDAPDVQPLIDSVGDVRLTGMTISPAYGADAQGASCIKTLTVSLQLAAGEEKLNVSASASPRRNLSY